MSNHMHLTPRNRPDIARCWSAREVAERWLRVVSTHERDDGSEEPPREEKINAITMDPERVEELRKRLSSISCFMAKLNEYISRRANKEEGITGRFWEGRFKSSQLSDAAAIVACMAYVDLNPIRAKMAESLEDSEYTSAQSRLVAELARKRIRSYQKRRRDGDSLTERQEALLTSARKSVERASWLVSLKGPDSP
jgi:REP-associated tyrosine transposase